MQQQPRLPLWFFLTNLGLILAAFILGDLLARWRRPDYPQPQAQALELVYAEILRSHVDAQDGKALLDRALAAMAHVDEYSAYIPPRNVADYEESATGQYEGIGIVQLLHGEEMLVHFPFAAGPAERAGILPGDRLLAVDGKNIAELPLSDRATRLRDLVRGPANTEVRLRIRRGTEELDIDVRRGGVQRPAVKWIHLADPEHGIGYLHLSDFHRGVADALRDAIRQLKASGDLRGLILDLRHNRGGSLDECIAIARMFVGQGTIVSTRRRGEVLETVRADATQCTHPDLPLAVLVNQDSASASEVLAGCLQDHRRALILGTRTFGKGFVNTVYTWGELPFRLKLTTAHYYTPNGRNIERKQKPIRGNRSTSPDQGTDEGGILPDQVIDLAPELGVRIESQLAQIEPPPHHRRAVAALAAELGLEPIQPPAATSDPQLAAAMQHLRPAAASTTPENTTRPK